MHHVKLERLPELKKYIQNEYFSFILVDFYINLLTRFYLELRYAFDNIHGIINIGLYGTKYGNKSDSRKKIEKLYSKFNEFIMMNSQSFSFYKFYRDYKLKNVVWIDIHRWSKVLMKIFFKAETFNV